MEEQFGRFYPAILYLQILRDADILLFVARDPYSLVIPVDRLSNQLFTLQLWLIQLMNARMFR